MQCSSCGGYHTGILKTCPFCGAPTADDMVYSHKTAVFLAKPRTVGNLTVTAMNIILVLAINLSLAALVINLFTYDTTGLWFQYVSCSAFAIYSLLRGFFGARDTVLRTVRRTIMFAFLALSVSSVSNNILGHNETADVIVKLVLPMLLILLGVLAVVFLFTRLASSASFCYTCIVGTVLSTVLLIIALTQKTACTPVIVYIAFGFSVFMLANYLLIRILSIGSWFKRGL